MQHEVHGTFSLSRFSIGMSFAMESKAVTCCEWDTPRGSWPYPNKRWPRNVVTERIRGDDMSIVQNGHPLCRISPQLEFVAKRIQLRILLIFASVLRLRCRVRQACPPMGFNVWEDPDDLRMQTIIEMWMGFRKFSWLAAAALASERRREHSHYFLLRPTICFAIILTLYSIVSHSGLRPAIILGFR